MIFARWIVPLLCQSQDLFPPTGASEFSARSPLCDASSTLYRHGCPCFELRGVLRGWRGVPPRHRASCARQPRLPRGDQSGGGRGDSRVATHPPAAGVQRRQHQGTRAGGSPRDAAWHVHERRDWGVVCVVGAGGGCRGGGAGDESLKNDSFLHPPPTETIHCEGNRGFLRRCRPPSPRGPPL